MVINCYILLAYQVEPAQTHLLGTRSISAVKCPTAVSAKDKQGLFGTYPLAPAASRPCRCIRAGDQNLEAANEMRTLKV